MKLTRIIRTFPLIVLSLVVLLVVAPTVSADNFPDDFEMKACQGITGDPGCATSNGGDPGTSIQGALDAGLNIISYVVGVAAVIALVLGGLRFITASGDPQNIAAARSTVIYAIVGIVVALVAQAIVRFVLTNI